MILAGQKINLARVKEENLDFICELECNRNIWIYEGFVQSDKSKVREDYLKKMKSNTSYDFVITTKIDGEDKAVGLAQIWSYIEDRKSWELGYAVLPEYQGKGYGYEATKLLLMFAFETLQAHKAVGMCNCNNLSSATLMEKVGMQREGTFREEFFWNNQWTDQYFYSILDKEYFEKYTKEDSAP